MELTGIVIFGMAHPKNMSGMIKGCQMMNIPYLIATSIEQIAESKFNFVWLPDKFSPFELPGKKIMYGPHFSVFPHGKMVAPWEGPDDCYYNVLSEWNKNIHEEMGLKMPMVCLPFGVDSGAFVPGNGDRNDVFVYCKGRHPSIKEFVLQKLGNRKIHIVQCGSYKEDWYKLVLSQCKFGVWIGSHESQGFALQEAMSCDVPLLVVNVTSMKDEWHGEYIYKDVGNSLLATSVPYWSNDCGEVVSLEDFDEGLKKIESGKYQPRNFVLENLSLDKCMTRMLIHFGFKI